MSEKLLRRYIREYTGIPATRTSGRGDVPPESPLIQFQPNKAGPTHTVKPGATAGVLDEDDEETQEDRGAACVLIVSSAGQVLAVSRRDDPTDFGLPGGKIDPGEDAETAARRELQEETGLTVGELTMVHSEHDGNMLCTTFMGQADGEIDTDESGVIRWVDPEVLLQGSFKGYNLRLFKKVGMM